jgi:hypothetical protein
MRCSGGDGSCADDGTCAIAKEIALIKAAGARTAGCVGVGSLSVNSEVDETAGNASQQQLRVGSGASCGLAGFSFGVQQQLGSSAFSAAPTTGSQQHQPIGVASRKLQRCTRIRPPHCIRVLLARATRFVKRIMKFCTSKSHPRPILCFVANDHAAATSIFSISCGADRHRLPRKQGVGKAKLAVLKLENRSFT